MQSHLWGTYWGGGLIANTSNASFVLYPVPHVVILFNPQIAMKWNYCYPILQMWKFFLTWICPMKYRVLFFFPRLLKSDRILLSIILIKAPVHNTNESEAALLEGKGWRPPSSSREAHEAALLLPVGPTRKSSHQGGERERRARKVKRPVWDEADV